MVIDTSNILITDITEPWMQVKNISLHLLRMDAIHPEISGNKYFKLLPYLQQFETGNFKKIVTFGGAFSNYLHAIAYVCFKNNIPCEAYIRGAEVHNDTLNDCIKWGMQLTFIDRTTFDNYVNNKQYFEPDADTLLIPFGAYNASGLYGMHNIIETNNLAQYNYAACSIGTGTTFMGLCNNMPIQTQKIGFMATKDALLQQLLKGNNSTINADFTFRGFAKTTPELINFIINFYKQHHIILDIVYTSKMIFGLHQLIRTHQIQNGSKIIALHTGGIQGNRSCKEIKHLTLV
jgi:1-aminocyclopropane-1-carboxylate deaminase/D-cysteine desulfhydrase-like pyridoxal-dependent ACC family enzyme